MDHEQLLHQEVQEVLEVLDQEEDGEAGGEALQILETPHLLTTSLNLKFHLKLKLRELAFGGMYETDCE